MCHTKYAMKAELLGEILLLWRIKIVMGGGVGDE